MTWNNRNTTQSKLQNAYVNKKKLKNNSEKTKLSFLKVLHKTYANEKGVLKNNNENTHGIRVLAKSTAKHGHYYLRRT
jgi:hypothetical protein